MVPHPTRDQGSESASPGAAGHGEGRNPRTHRNVFTHRQSLATPFSSWWTCEASQLATPLLPNQSSGHLHNQGSYMSQPSVPQTPNSAKPPTAHPTSHPLRITPGSPQHSVPHQLPPLHKTPREPRSHRELKTYASISLTLQPVQEDHESDLGDDLPSLPLLTPWYRQLSFYLWSLGLVVCLGVIVVGVTLNIQLDLDDHVSLQPFRWLAFLAAWPILWQLSRLVSWQCFQMAEWYYYRKALYFWGSIQSTSTHLLFFLLVLAWYEVVYNWAWCGGVRCNDEEYSTARDMLWKLVLCLFLFSLANFLKSLMTKLMSTHFYSSTHFNNVRRELEKEYYLLALSTPREELLGSDDEAEGGGLVPPAEPGSTPKSTGATPRSTNVTPRSFAGDHPFQEVPPTPSRRPVRSMSRQATLEKLRGIVDAAKHNAGTGEYTAPRLERMGSRRGRSSTDQGSRPVSPAVKTTQTARATSMPSATSLDDVVVDFTPAENGPSGQAGREKVGQSSRKEGEPGQSQQLAGSSNLWRCLSFGARSAKVPRGHPYTAHPQRLAQNSKGLTRLRTLLAVRTISQLMERYKEDGAAGDEQATVKQARQFGKGLFANIKGDANRDFLTREDFEQFFEDPDMAHAAHACFDKDCNGQISMEETIQTVVRITQDRRNLAATLKDTDSIVNSLEYVVGLIVHFFFLLIYLPIWGVGIMAGFNAMSASVLALTFIFGESLKNTYENAVYLFVEHPFDVGDMLLLNSTPYKVKKISLLYSVLQTTSGENTYFNLRSLRESKLVNLSKSDLQWDTAHMMVDMVGARHEVIEKLAQAMMLHTLANPGDFHQEVEPSIFLVSAKDPLKMQLELNWSYSFRGEHCARVKKVRTGMLLVVAQALQSCHVTFTLPYPDRTGNSPGLHGSGEYNNSGPHEISFVDKFIGDKESGKIPGEGIGG